MKLSNLYSLPACLNLNATDLFQLRLRREATWKFNTDEPRNYSSTTFQVDGQRVSGAVLDSEGLPTFVFKKSAYKLTGHVLPYRS